MKTRIVIGFFLITILAFTGLALADGKKQEDFFMSCIDSRIARCESKSALARSRSDTICNYAALNLAKAEFYKDNRGQLILQLVAEDVPMKCHRVDYLLNKAFFDQLNNGLTLAEE